MRLGLHVSDNVYENNTVRAVRVSAFTLAAQGSCKGPSLISCSVPQSCTNVSQRRILCILQGLTRSLAVRRPRRPL